MPIDAKIDSCIITLGPFREFNAKLINPEFFIGVKKHCEDLKKKKKKRGPRQN